MTNKEVSIKYAEDILNGKILACDLIKSACSKFIRDFETYDYKEKEVYKVTRFFDYLKLTEYFEKQPFVLLPWQVFFITCIYGFYDKVTGLRKVRRVYLEVPRKNGKTQLLSALALYHTMFDKSAEVIISANSLYQVNEVTFSKILSYVGDIDPLQKELKVYHNKIKYKKNKLLVFASEPKKMDGFNASVGMIDELHEDETNGMIYNKIKTSQKTRLEGALLYVITTAGDNTDSFCYQLRTYCVQLLEGTLIDESQFALIYTINEGDDYRNSDSIKKANPSLGVTFFEFAIQEEINTAVNNPVEEAAVKRLYFNIWLQRANIIQSYIDHQYITKSSLPVDLNDYKGYDCYIGIDLAATTDLTALSVFIPTGGKYVFKLFYFLPVNNLNTNINKKQFNIWANQNFITLTPGNTCDYDYILNLIKQISEILNIQSIYYDKANASQFIINTTDAGFNCYPYSQSNMSMNAPTKELLRQVLNDNVIFDDSPVTKYCFNNVVLEESRELVHPYKLKQSSKIDGVIACIIVIGGYLGMNHYSFDIT